MSDLVHGEDEWEPTRWWRVMGDDPSGPRWANRRVLWCETSDEQEARSALETCSDGVLQRLYRRTEQEWRLEQ